MADVLDVRFFARAFFDTEGVVRRLSAGERRLFVRYGGAVRTIARRSMRPGGKKYATARPGEPPRTHEGSLRRLLFFAYEPDAHTVVIGPALFSARSKAGGGKTVPELMERGGSVPANGRVVTADRKPTGGEEGRFVSARDAKGRFATGGVWRVKLTGAVTYKGNAFMGPAAAKAGPVLTDGLGNLLR